MKKRNITKQDIKNYIKELKMLYENEFVDENAKNWYKKQYEKFTQKLKEIKD